MVRYPLAITYSARWWNTGSDSWMALKCTVELLLNVHLNDIPWKSYMGPSIIFHTELQTRQTHVAQPLWCQEQLPYHCKQCLKDQFIQQWMGSIMLQGRGPRKAFIFFSCPSFLSKRNMLCQKTKTCCPCGHGWTMSKNYAYCWTPD